MGSLFAEAFRKQGIEVFQTGRNTELTNIQASEKGDIVIISVPIRDTKEVINEIKEHVSEDAMITDFTSVKVNPCSEMLKSNAGEVIGGHPVFGPSTGFKDQNFVLCPVKKGKYYSWYKDFLEKLGLKVVEMSSDEHDKNMAVIQCLTHISNLSLGYALKKLDFDLDIARKLSSPVYMMRVYGVGRILAQDEKLYSDIQVENPYSKEMIKTYLESVKELNDIILSNRKESFEEVFLNSKDYFWDILDESMRHTDNMIKQMTEEKDSEEAENDRK